MSIGVPGLPEAGMTAAGIVLLCAFDSLGRSPGRFPPSEILNQPPPHASVGVEGFADRAKGVVYLIASAPAFLCWRRIGAGLPSQVPRHGFAEDRGEHHRPRGMAPDRRPRRGGRLLRAVDDAAVARWLGPESVPYKCVKRAMQSVLAARRQRVRSPWGPFVIFAIARLTSVNNPWVCWSLQ